MFAQWLRSLDGYGRSAPIAFENGQQRLKDDPGSNTMAGFVVVDAVEKQVGRPGHLAGHINEIDFLLVGPLPENAILESCQALEMRITDRPQALVIKVKDADV